MSARPAPWGAVRKSRVSPNPRSPVWGDWLGPGSEFAVDLGLGFAGIGLRTAVGLVDPHSAVEQIVTPMTPHQITARLPPQLIVARTTVEAVVPPAAPQPRSLPSPP